MGKKRLSIVKTCERCGKEFNPWSETARYCGNRCSATASGEARQTIAVKACVTCGREFRPVASRRKYCSRECYAADPNAKREHGKYVMIYRPDAPGAYTSGQIFEHRFVMQEAIGRALEPDETVHHINGDTRDNRLANLQLRTGRHGKGVVHQCNSCGSRDISAVPLD